MIKINKRIVPIALAVCRPFPQLPRGAGIFNNGKCQILVYVAASGNGACYHTSKNCSRMRGRVVKKTKKAAKRQGYRACKKCYR